MSKIDIVRGFNTNKDIIYKINIIYNKINTNLPQVRQKVQIREQDS